MSLLQKLVDTPPSEDGGASATKGFAYQQDWTLCLLLKLHQDGDDYVVLCDYHDDVVVVRPDEPIDFFQLKSTKTKRWTLKRFIGPKKTKGKPDGPSCLAKLYQHRLDFGDECGNLTFVTNLPFSSFDMGQVPDCGSRTQFNAADLAASAVAELKVALQKQLGCTSGVQLDGTLIFWVDGLGYESHRETTLGVLVDYLNKRVPNQPLPVPAIYTALRDEIGRKTEHTAPCSSASQLTKMKGMERTEVENAIDSFIQLSSLDPRQAGEAVARELQDSGLAYGRRQQIAQGVESYSVQRMDGSRAELTKASAVVREARGALGAKAATMQSLWEMVCAVDELIDVDLGFDEDYRLGVIAWECHHYGRQLPSPDAFVEEEAE